MATPMSLPVMSEDGTGFLNGSIQSDVYLRSKRAQTRELATLELQRDRRSFDSNRLVLVGVLAVAASNLFAGITSIAGGNNKLGALGLAIAALIGISSVGFRRVATRSNHRQ